jgi:hypothetical protein
MKRSIATLLLAASSLLAVTLRQDYFPLAVGNIWHYSSAEDSDGYKYENSVYVSDVDDTSFGIGELPSHPLIDFSVSEPQRVTLDVEGVLNGFRYIPGVYRNCYYNSENVYFAEDLSAPFARDTFRLDTDTTTYTNVWGFNDISISSSQTANNTVLAPGIGMLGYGMDLSTEEYPETAHGGFQLDSFDLVPTPTVTEVQSATLFVPMDSSLNVIVLDDSTISIDYSISTGLLEWSVVTSSYNELTNTLRIWLADTVQYVQDPTEIPIVLFQDDETTPSEGSQRLAVTAGGEYSHTHRIEQVDLSKDLNLKVFYKNSNSDIVYARSEPSILPTEPILPYESQTIVYDETLSFEKTPKDPTSVLKAATTAVTTANNTLSISGNQVQINLPAGERGNINIQDLRGRVIAQRSISGSTSISLKGLGLSSQGVYLLRVNSKSSSAVHKISIR